MAGADIVRDAVTFFQAFEGMEEGFRNRAAQVRKLLAEPTTAFVLVASPRPDSVDEAVHFSAKLTDAGMSPPALIVNRVQPRFADDSHPGRSADRCPRDRGVRAASTWWSNLRGYTAASDREEQTYADLVADVAPAPVARVPLLNSDVHDLGGLATIADLLFPAGEGTPSPSAPSSSSPPSPSSGTRSSPGKGTRAAG